MAETPVTVAYGDGIGPEIMKATLAILDAADAGLTYDVIQIGEKVYEQGFTSGIQPEAWDSLRRTKLFLKSPITTPQGKGFKSLNVTIRKSLGLFANVRPVISYEPFVDTKFSGIDLVIVRENEEDLYAGIEHRQTDEVYQCLKLITRPGCEKIVRYAFEYAKQYGRKKVTCFSKDNIMKLTDGLFHGVFDEIAAEYPSIENEHWIVDIGAAKVAAQPDQFDVIVMPNLYGDIVSDIAALVAGSVGMSGSANVGESVSMFEAIHGSAPDIAGQQIANPSGLLHGALLMLLHIGKSAEAERIYNAWCVTLEEGLHTADIYEPSISEKKLNTAEFADAVIARLGKKPSKLKAVSYADVSPTTIAPYKRKSPEKKVLQGVDAFVCHTTLQSDEVADMLNKANTDSSLELQMITNRGVKVWPNGLPETFVTDHWRCRFTAATDDVEIDPIDIITLLESLTKAGVEVIKTENLYTFDGVAGFSLGQGQ